MQQEEIRTIPIGDIDEPKFLLRRVLRQSKEFLELKTSIEKYGLFSSLLVRPKGDRFELVAGFWRFSACSDLGKETVPCIVREMSDEDVMSLQLQENAVRYKTMPVEYASHLKRILDQNPGMSFTKLAAMVCKHPTWVKGRLGLLKLDREVQKLVDRGKMIAGNAVMLAKIPAKWRESQIDNACNLPEREFKPIAAALIKKYQEAVRDGKLEAHFVQDYQPVAYCRPPLHIQKEMESPEAGPIVIVVERCKTHMDVWKAACAWAIHLDQTSIEEQRRKVAQSRNFESEDSE